MKTFRRRWPLAFVYLFAFDFAFQHELSGSHIVADDTAAGIHHKCAADIDAKAFESHTTVGLVFAEAGSTNPQIPSIARRMCLFHQIYVLVSMGIGT